MIWLRAKARYDRWEEELKLLPKEMSWTVASFRYKGEAWSHRAEKYKDQVGKDGHYSYALRQVAMWGLWTEKANFAFEKALKGS